MRKTLVLILSLILVFPAGVVFAEYPGEEAGFKTLDFAPQIVFDEEASEFGYLGYKFVDENGDEIQPQYDDIATFANLPSYYRNVNLTPVKNQGSVGCCWAFAFIGAMEANLIKQGYHAERLDFSEAHLAYFAKNIRDSINNDGPESIGSRAYTEGGNDFIALAAIAKGSGVVSESVMPYEEYTKNLKEAPEYEAKAVDEDYRFLCEAGVSSFKLINPANNSAIKQAIIQYGSVINTYHAPETKEEASLYHNTPNAAYHCPASENINANHATLIVGWDDDYSKENFNEECRPQNDGAWIVRNSWGETYGEGGYFYLSYETELFTTSALKAAYEEYDNNYGYTGGIFNSYSNVLTVYSNIFTADSNEILEAVSFYAAEPAEVMVSVYKNVGNYPSNGELAFRATLTFSGNYVKIPFSQGIEINEGEKYSIIIDGATVYCEPNTCEEYGVYTKNNYESWYYKDKVWYYGFNNLSIRAHTNENRPKITAQIRNNKIETNSKYNNNSILYIAQYMENELVDVQIASEATLNTAATRYRVFSWDADMNSTTGYFVEDEI